MTGITGIGADAAQESQPSGGDDDEEYEYEFFDLEGSIFGRQHPTTAVRGTAVALRSLYDENDPDRSDVAVVMDDPSLVTHDEGLENSVVVLSEDEGDQYKVVNLDDKDTSVLTTEGKSDELGDRDLDDLLGIQFGSDSFYGDVVGDFDTDVDVDVETDRIALKRGGGAGRAIANTLDVNGATQASVVRDEDGELVLHDGGFPKHNGGLMEYDPRSGDDSEPPRRAREPEIRDDVEGNEVVVMIQRLSEIDPDYDGRAYWSTVFANLSEDRMDELAEQYADDAEDKSKEHFLTEIDGETFVRLQPTDEFEPSEANIRDRGWIEWNKPDAFGEDHDEDALAELNEKRAEMDLDPYEPGSSDDD